VEENPGAVGGTGEVRQVHGPDDIHRLGEEIARLDTVLGERARFLAARRQWLRERIAARVGRLRTLRCLSADQVREWLEGRSLAGVDGSCNLVGGPYPHYVAVMAAVARTTRGEEVWAWQVWSPLDREERLGEEADEMARRRALSALEARVAAQALERYSPRLLLVDGPLVRLRIEAEQEWEELFSRARRQGTLPVGVIESVGTSLVASLLGEDLPPSWRGAFDRELLWGLLEPGEMLTVEHPHRPGLRTCFMRAGQDPAPTGLDFPAMVPADENLETVADVLYTLTPRGGRGIPLWIDLVDARVRLEDHVVRALVESGISRENWLRFLASRRERRPY
jgi:hypothetical protein